MPEQAKLLSHCPKQVWQKVPFTEESQFCLNMENMAKQLGREQKHKKWAEKKKTAGHWTNEPKLKISCCGRIQFVH